MFLWDDDDDDDNKDEERIKKFSGLENAQSLSPVVPSALGG